MSELQRWYRLREQAARNRALQVTVAQLAHSTVSVVVDDEEVDVPITDVIQEGVDAGEKADDAIDQVETVSRVPGQVTGVRVVSNVGSWGLGPRALVELAWDPIVTGVDGNPLAIASYEVIDGSTPVATVTTATAVLDVPSGTIHEYRVRATTIYGVAGDPSDPAVTVTAEYPTLVPLKPTPPTLESSFGVVVARWDGLYTTAGHPAAHSVMLERRIVSGNTVTWERVGAGLTGAGSVTVPGVVDETMILRLVAYDQLGRETGVSAQAEIVVVGVRSVDLDAAIRDAIDQLDDWSEAIGLAGGKLTLADRAPLPADGVEKPVPALWMQHTGGAFTKLYEWNGTAWTERPLAEEILPKVAIGAGTYGELEGDRLKARTVASEKMLVGDFRNYWNDPEFRHPSGYAPWTVNGLGVEKPGTGTQSGGYWDSSEIYVQPGERLKLTITKTHVTGTTSEVAVFVRRRTATGEQSGANTLILRLYGGDGDYSGEWTIPEGVERLSFGFWTQATTPSTTRVRLSNVRIHKMETGELLVDGGVLARHIQVDEAMVTKLLQTPELWAGRVKADFLEPNVGDTLYLGANEAIEMIVARQDDTDEAVSVAQEAADTAQTAAEDAAGLAGDAQGAAERAAEDAAGAQLVAEEARDGVTGLQSAFRVLPTHVAVSTVPQPGVVPHEMRMYPDRAQMVQGNTVLSEWNGGQMIVSETILNRVQIGTKATRGHQIQQAGPGRTTFRPIQ